MFDPRFTTSFVPSIRTLTSAIAIVLATSSTGAFAQETAEQASAAVNRYAPAASDPTLSGLQVPPGFTVSVFARGLEHPRMMETGPDGTVYVTRRDRDDVLALRDVDGDGRADDIRVFASGLDGVHGIARRGETLYLASSTTIWTTPVAAAAPAVIVSGLPDGGQHANRMLRFGPDGSLYVSVGSSCNDCAEGNQLERATMIRYTPDGQQRSVVAKGLRNTIGYDWHPRTGALWGMDHGSDFRGDDIPPEELNRIVAGANYGWPICYGDRVVDPMTNAQPANLAFKPGASEPLQRPISREAYCAKTVPSVLTMAAHSAPMAMTFYNGTQFPAEFANDAFVALRGSWNRGSPVGYKVVRLRFSASGQPLGFEDFLTGFLATNGSTITGRPVGLVQASDGALLVSDDTEGVIYRISHRTR